MPRDETIGRHRLIEGDALHVLARIGGPVDAVIADPPYCSGGASASARRADPRRKYVSHHARGVAYNTPFDGDNLDQRSWTHWCALWLGQCATLLRPGGYAMVFSDWRQLPALTDAIQAAGLIWRGIVIWDKTPGSRAPNKSYYRHQAEYIVWATRGAPAPTATTGPWAGVITHWQPPAAKHHLAAKPIPVLQHLMAPLATGSRILDPFAGSASVAVAAHPLGHRTISIERSSHWYQVAASRLAAAVEPAPRSPRSPSDRRRK